MIVPPCAAASCMYRMQSHSGAACRNETCCRSQTCHSAVVGAPTLKASTAAAQSVAAARGRRRRPMPSGRCSCCSSTRAAAGPVPAPWAPAPAYLFILDLGRSMSHAGLSLAWRRAAAASDQVAASSTIEPWRCGCGRGRSSPDGGGGGIGDRGLTWRVRLGWSASWRQPVGAAPRNSESAIPTMRRIWCIMKDWPSTSSRTHCCPCAEGNTPRRQGLRLSRFPDMVSRSW